MAKNSADCPYFLLTDLAKDWECSEEEIIDYGIRGELKICALGNYWTLQEGVILDKNTPAEFYEPTKDRETGVEPIPLTRPAIREILSCDAVINPEFIFEDGEGQSKGEEQYERFLSSILIIDDIGQQQNKIIVTKEDLVIRKEDVELFLTDNSDMTIREPKTYDLSTMKKEDRDKLVLDYAVRIWEEYRKENGTPPRIGYVHQKIKENPSFTYSKERPSKNTICKPITDAEVSKKIQSRKNAQKRA